MTTYVVGNETDLRTALSTVAAGDVITLTADITLADDGAELLIDKSAVTLNSSGDFTLALTNSAYGIHVTGAGVNVENLNVVTNAGNVYGFKVDGTADGFSMENVNVTGGASGVAGYSRGTEIDLNGVNGATITNVTISGGDTSGNGISLTDSPSATLVDVTTSDNQWGGIALYGTSTTETTFAGTISTAEDNGIYAQASGEITGTDFPAGTDVYLVTNDTFRPSGEQFTFFRFSEADAVATAQGLGNPEDSVIRGPFDPAGVSTSAGDGVPNTFIVAEGMSIQEAVDAADAGDIIKVLAGTYTEDITINKDITLQGANAGTSGTGTRETESIIEGGIEIHGNGVTVDGFKFDGTSVFSGERGSIFVQADNVAITNNVFQEDGVFRDDDGGIDESGIITASTSVATRVDVSGNSFSGYDYGVYVNPGNLVSINENSFLENRIGVVDASLDNDAVIDSNTFADSATTHIFAVVTESDSDLSNYADGNTFSGSAPELIVGGYDSRYYAANGGINTVVGSNNDDKFVVYSSDGAVNFAGGAGDDTLSGAGGADTLSGGAGGDVFAGTAAGLNGDNITDLVGGEVIDLTDDDTIAQSDINYDATTGVLTVDNTPAGQITINITNKPNGSFSVNGDGNLVFAAPTAGGGGGGGGGTGGGTAGQAFPGTDGDDTLVGSDDADTITAGAGSDSVLAGGGDDVVFGGAGSDTLAGGEGNDQIYGGSGNDAIAGGAGNDILGGGEDNDTLFGGEGDDTVFGGVGDDLAYGGEGNDNMFGGSGADTLAGGNGDDEIGGGTGNDQIAAGDGADTVYGADGEDTIFAGGGADSVFGGSGNDVIYLGNTGGTPGDGAQDVYSSTADNGDDLVYGFEHGTDLLNLTASGYGSFADISGQIGQDADGNATIDLGNGDILTLVGVDPSTLDNSDFQF